MLQEFLANIPLQAYLGNVVLSIISASIGMTMLLRSRHKNNAWYSSLLLPAGVAVVYLAGVYFGMISTLYKLFPTG